MEKSLKPIQSMSNQDIVDYLRTERRVILPIFVEKWVMEYWLEGEFSPEQFKNLQDQIKRNFTPTLFEEIREWILYNDEVVINPPQPREDGLPF